MAQRPNTICRRCNWYREATEEAATGGGGNINIHVLVWEGGGRGGGERKGRAGEQGRGRLCTRQIQTPEEALARHQRGKGQRGAYVAIVTLTAKTPLENRQEQK